MVVNGSGKGGVDVFYVDSTPPADVPEPGTLALMLAGVGMAVAGRRVRNKAAAA